MIYNQLNDACAEVEKMIVSPKSSKDDINDKLLSLSTCIHINGEAIQADLIKHQDHLSLLQRIGQIKQDDPIVKDIKNSCALLELKVLLQGDDPKKIADWVLKNKEGISSKNPQELFKDLSKARERLSKANLLNPDVGYALSDLVTAGLGLKGQKKVAIVKNTIASILQRESLEALAHWINSEKIPLKNTGLSQNELEAIAPYLHHVHCENQSETFIKLCSNAFFLKMSNSNIEVLPLPPKLQTFDCFNCQKLFFICLSKCPQLKELVCFECPQLETIPLSNNPQLQQLDCSCCRKLTGIDLTHNPQLQTLNCIGCMKLTGIDLAHNPQLQRLYCSGCPFKTLDLTHNKQLRTLQCSDQQFITELDLSPCPLLQELRCTDNPNLTSLDLTNNPQLKDLDCNNCPRLISLGESLSNCLEKLNCENCSSLTQLPQMPPSANVRSTGSPCGNLHSFTIHPVKLEKEPKQVLLDLGKILLENKPMPNIVYLNSPGLDSGGLRRQLVATLCENLFKPDSKFPYIKDDGYDIPLLGDVIALRTFARLLGLGIPTGTNLHPSFFHALFALSDEELESPLSESLQKKLHMARHGLTEADQDIAEESNVLAAIAIVAKELLALLGPKFRVLGKNVNEFMINVQGSKVTKENLKENITCNKNTYKEWLNDFIDELPEQDLKRFVMLLTGSYTLSGDKITFKVYPERKHAESSSVIHTCIKTMELASDYDKDELKKELKVQLKLIKSFNAI